MTDTARPASPASNSAAGPVSLPRIDAGLCVHSLCAVASCTKCITACPQGAWVFNDTALALDAAACDGCALCQAACPEGAIDFEPGLVSPLLDVVNETALAACERSGVAAGRGTIPCLHALGDRELAKCCERGVRKLITAQGDCASCSRATNDTLQEAVGRFTRLRASRGRKAFTHEAVGAADWERSRSAALAKRNDLDQSRRSLFTFSLPREPRGGPVAASGAVEGVGQLYRFSPRIDAARCTGCDACPRLCPHAAITLSRAGGGLAYRIQPASCTGCNLCVDVCEAEAVALESMVPAVQGVVVLSEGRCSKCGAPFHRPEGQGGEGGGAVCRICQKTNHAGRLFQVRP